MGRIDVVLSDELEKKFRSEIALRMGLKKGNISIAIEEAVSDWIGKKSGKRSLAARKAWNTMREAAASKE